ncbi:MAG: hypothetical protein DHS20C18_48120 [Saprospiraceae bacterium]|nr:MAG: hypothetical protein DHS20C18_48120 [Saprospiraceae bacterium]
MKNKVLFLPAFVTLLFSFCHAQEYQSLEIDLKDSKIYVRDFGNDNGTPLLLINGGPGFSSEGFVGLAKELSSHYRVILYDQRGTGKSGLSKIDTSTIKMDLMVADIEAIRNYIGIDNWIVMGHSFGGMLAYYYAVKHPDRIRAMIQSSSGGPDLDLFNTPASLGIQGKLTDAEQDSLNYWSQKISQGDTTFHANLKRAEFLAPAYLYNKKNVATVAARLTQGDMTINGLVWTDMRSIGFDCKEKLKTFTKPVLIIHGKEDILHTQIPKNAHELLPNSKLVLLEHCAHYGWLDRPDAYFSEIYAFTDAL